jgi:hypothetical protein
MVVIHLDQLTLYQGARLGQVALRREQWEQLESKHCEKLSRGKEGETKHSPWKKNGSTPVGHSGQTALRREQCNKKEHALLHRKRSCRNDI